MVDVIAKQSRYRALYLVGFFGDLFYSFFDFFYSFLNRCFLDGGLVRNLGDSFLCLGLNGLSGGLGKNLDGASLFGCLGLCTRAVVTLGVVALGGANSLVGGGCGGRSRYGYGGSGLLDNDFFYRGFFFDNFFDNFFYLGLIVIKFPGEVCVCGNDGFVFLYQLRYVIGIKLKGSRGLFLAQILTDKTTGNQCFGFGKGILFLVVDLFDIDGRESLLFAGTLYQFQCKRKLARRVDLVKERCLGIFLLAANVASAIDRILKCGGFKRKIKIERARTDVDFCNLRAIVCVGIDAPTHTLLGALIAHKRVADSTVILFGGRTRLHQLCLTALAIASNDVATGFFVKTNDAFVAKEITFVFVIVLFCIGFSFCFVFYVEFVLGIQLVEFFFVSVNRLTVLLCRMCHSDLTLHTELEAELLELVNRLAHFLGNRVCVLILGNGGGVGLSDNLASGFDDVLFNNRSLSGNALGDDGALNGVTGLCHRGVGILGNNSPLFGGVGGILFLISQKSVKSLLRVIIVPEVIGKVDFVAVFILTLHGFIVNFLLLCIGRYCGLFFDALFYLVGNEQIPLGVQNSQQSAKNKRTHCGSNRQHQKGQL